jgi:3-oxoacyl-[acyl-carrier-protein] synthase II
LEDAGLDRGRVRYVNAHGTGTPANDKAETKAIRRVFGVGAAQLAVSSQKAVFGHTLGAAGALETAATLLCQEKGILPPTANFTEARDGCDLDYVPVPGRPWPEDPRGRVWIKESFAFGGHDASVVLGAPQSAELVREAALPPARVCVAGVGLVTSAGAGRAAFLRLLAGMGPELGQCTPKGHTPFEAALVPDSLDPALERRLGLSRMDKAGALGIVAAHLALAEAGIVLRPDVAAKVGLYLGHASGSNAAEASFVPDLLRSGYVLQSVAEFPFVVPNATAGTICRSLGLRGHNAAFCFGEGAGLMSLVTGALAIQNRHAPFLLAGAVDVLTQRGWGVPLPGGDGVPAEGAVFFLLEEEEHLRQRGGRSLGRITGMAVATHTGGSGSECPPADRVRSVAEAALAQAGMEAGTLGAACGPAAALLGLVPLAAAPRMGTAEACGPLFDLTAGLLGGGGAGGGLLGSISSRQGLTASVVMDRVCFEENP